LVSAAEQQPSVDVVAAFGGDVAALAHLPGGQGASWRAGSLVLKRVENEQEVSWLAALLERVADGPEFRVGRAIRSPDGSYVVDGWAATGWLEGTHEPGRFDDLLATSDAFHRALAVAPVPWPDFLRDRTSPWAMGDRVAWGEASMQSGTGAVRAVFDRLIPLLAADSKSSAPQVIHGDIGGNILFADASGLPPAIIDVSPYYRPRSFASAILVADAVAWDHAPLTTASRFLAMGEARAELLARAVVFRLAAALQLWGATSARVEAEVDAYRPIVSLLDLP
jgi:uncharacterized protein (TIGR02569 family)